MEKQKRKRKKKVVKFNSPISINIGIVVFGLILVYILINAVIYFTTEKTKYYEVVTGSNAKGINTSYVGIAMRNGKAPVFQKIPPCIVLIPQEI